MATYYVSNSGSDAAAGTSASVAWQTVAKVLSVTLLPGDRVLFKRGDSWREQLTLAAMVGSAAAPIVFGAYGTSATPPTLTGAATVSAAGWSLHSGTTYKITLAQGSPTYAAGQAAVDTAAVVLEDEVALTQKASAAAVAGTAGSYAWVAGVLYVRASDSTNPGTNGKTYEVPARDYCVFLSGVCSYITLENLRFQGAMQMGVLTLEYATNNVTIVGCTARWNCGSGIRTIGVGIYVARCTAYGNRRYGGFTGFFQPGNVSVVERCTSYGNGTDVAYDADSYYRDHGFYFDGTDVETRYCVAYSNTAHGFKAGRYTKGASMVWRRNVAYENGHCGAYVDQNDVSYNTAAKTRWFHNVFHRNGVGFRTDFATTISFTDNIISDTLSVGEGINGTGILFSGGGSVQTCDYNCVFGSAVANYNGPTAGPHDINASPQFVDASANDYRLAASSPCVGTGSERDLDIDASNATPDIGRWEYGFTVLSAPLIEIFAAATAPTASLTPVTAPTASLT